MYTIKVCDKESPMTEYFKYQSEIVPMAGDIYTGNDFPPDSAQRTVINRLLIPTLPETIIVLVEKTHKNI